MGLSETQEIPESKIGVDGDLGLKENLLHQDSDAPPLVNEGATCYANSVLKMIFASNPVTLAIGM